MDRDDVQRWVAAYEASWRTPGTESLTAIITEDATYLVSPWAEPVTGLAALAELWDAEREGADEEFTMSSEVVAVDGQTAVVRAEVAYARGETWRDLWLLRFDEDGRCRAFEEWPFAPERPDGH
jgi:ketosteroid isomerase-like protein